ncbi:hypothetical protein L2755_21545 [Shewanella abyssi]|uniref:hypothetical protein n=1 Tax=Shewanella abyssi TaxID=311789 RepID=UPI00200F7ACD|nr:hypothetical protein [Shewanella abyssi]MCL1052183.1 hypothetical protein [Shewanella abyssi]
MRIFLILAILISFITQAGSLVDTSYENIKIGMSAHDATKLLKEYESGKLNSEDVSCYYLSPSQDDDLPHFMIESNTVVRIEVFSNAVITQDGVTVGSSKNEVMAVYKNLKASPHPYNFQTGEYLEVKLPDGNGIIFETDNDIVTSFRLGSYPAISYIEGCL